MVFVKLFNNNLKKILFNKNLIAVFINGFLPLCYTVVFNFYGTYRFGLEFFGDFSYYVAIATTINTLVTFGVTTYSSRFIVELIHFKKSPGHFLINVYLIEFLKLVPVISILYLVSNYIDLNLLAISIILVTNVLVILPISFFFQLRDARGLFSRSFSDLLLLNLGKIGAFYFYCFIFHRGQIITFFLVSTVIPNVVFLWYLCMRYKIHQHCYNSIKLNGLKLYVLNYKSELENLYKFSAKLSPLILFESITSNIGVFYLKDVTGNREIGIYKLFQTILSIIQMLNSLWSKYITPSLVVHSFSFSVQRMSRLINNAILGNVIVACCISMLVIFLHFLDSPSFLVFKYFDSQSVIIIPGILIVVSTGIVGSLYTSMNKPHLIPVFVGSGSLVFASQVFLLPVSINNILIYHLIGYLLTQLLSFFYAIYILDFRLKRIFYGLIIFAVFLLITLLMLAY